MKSKKRSFLKYLKSFENSPYYFTVLHTDDNDEKVDKKELDDDWEKTAQLRYIQNATAGN